tara:strand:+ start:559 stop:675 length:117 start_codon:yes stop_codon:yes gene_type:complete
MPARDNKDCIRAFYEFKTALHEDFFWLLASEWGYVEVG